MSGLLGGCFPAGLPERFAPPAGAGAGVPLADPVRRLRADQTALAQALRAPVVLYVEQSTPGLENGETAEGRAAAMLGCQYLLGIFPFTRLYLQHGASHLLRESTIEQLLAAGRTAAVANSRGLSEAASLLSPEAIIVPEIKEISLNGYDALFFRYLKASGLVTFRYGRDAQTRRELNRQIDQSEFRAFAHLPALARVLETSFLSAAGSALKEILDPALGPQRGRREQTAVHPESGVPGLAVFILPPRIAPELVQQFGQLFAGSYNIGGMPAFNAAQVGRIFQTGLAAGSAAAGMYPAELIAHQPRKFQPPSAAGSVAGLSPDLRGWVLAAEIRSAAAGTALPQGGIALNVELTLYSIYGGNLQLAYSNSEEIYKPVVDTDGAWIVTAEQAAAGQAARFFDGQFPNGQNFNRAAGTE